MEENNKIENNAPAAGGADPNRGLKITVIVLAVVAVVLAGVFAYVWYDRQKMIDDLTVDKENLTQELIDLQGEYALLSTDNDSLNVQLDREREKVSQLLDRIQEKVRGGQPAAKVEDSEGSADGAASPAGEL